VEGNKRKRSHEECSKISMVSGMNVGGGTCARFDGEKNRSSNKTKVNWTLSVGKGVTLVKGGETKNGIYF